MAARWRPNGIVLSESQVAEIDRLARRLLKT